jgi:predicted DNA-binding transcriptional regulator AlpA
MDPNQTKITDLLREVHLIAFKEIERLNLRIAELDSQDRRPAHAPAQAKAAVERPAPTLPAVPKQPESGLMNEHEVAAYLKISVASVRRWRLLRTGPKFLKIGSAVRYKGEDVEAWLNLCPGLR